MIVMAMLVAVAVILMYFEFPLTFIAPAFYEMDLSEVPIMIGSFMLGPCAGVLMEAVKVILKICIKGTTTAFVGDFAKFPAGLLSGTAGFCNLSYKKDKKKSVCRACVRKFVFYSFRCYPECILSSS